MSREGYDGEDRREPERWRVKKEISVGDLIAFGAAFCSVVYAWSTLDKRVSLVEAGHVQQQKIDSRQDDDTLRRNSWIDAQLLSISAKLDRLIESRH